jgi:hypothetical protein
VPAKLAACVVERLVDSAACRSESLGHDVERHFVESDRDEDVALMRSECRLDSLAKEAKELVARSLIVGPVHTGEQR